MAPLKTHFMNFRRLSIALAIIALTFIPSAAHDATPQKLIPFEQDEKWGFVNSKGEIVIKPQFDKVEPFSEGLALVKANLKNGFIDASGKVVIELQYYNAFSFSEGLAAVTIKAPGTWGYIDHKGNAVIPARFAWAGSFTDGIAEVLLAPDPGVPNIDKSGYIDKTGNIIIDAKYGWAQQFADGLALIADDKPSSMEFLNRKAFIDIHGQRVTEFFDDAESFSEGLAAIRVNGLWGFIDKTGAVVIPPSYNLVSGPFSEGYAPVECVDRNIAFIDKRGRQLTDCSFKQASEFSEGLAAVQTTEGKWGFIDTRGQLAVKPAFAFAYPFFNGLAQVRIMKGDTTYVGYINRKGEYVIKPVKKKPIEN